MKITTDRGDIIHFAGFHHLSPARDAQGGPALSSGHGDGLTRCGWEAFFRAMRERHLAMAFSPEDPEVRFVPSSQEPDDAASHASLSHAMEHAKRFWKAFRGGGGGAAQAG